MVSKWVEVQAETIGPIRLNLASAHTLSVNEQSTVIGFGPQEYYVVTDRKSRHLIEQAVAESNAGIV